MSNIQYHKIKPLARFIAKADAWNPQLYDATEGRRYSSNMYFGDYYEAIAEAERWYKMSLIKGEII